jgi:hypothetical protein
MSSYSLDEVTKRWGRGTITAEQAIGQMLLLIRELTERIGALEKQQETRRNGGLLHTEHIGK